MASVKGSLASPKTQAPRLTDEELLASAEGRFCRPCRRIFPKKSHKDSHDRSKHVAPVAAAPRIERQVLDEGEVIFHSPKAAGLRLVIPGKQGQMVATGQAGRARTITKALVAEFKNGYLRTKNKRIIAYLSADRDACRKLKIGNFIDDEDEESFEPKVYKDARYPVFSQSQMREMAATLPE